MTAREARWFWCADWCKHRGLNPMFAYNWDSANVAYDKFIGVV